MLNLLINGDQLWTVGWARVKKAENFTLLLLECVVCTIISVLSCWKTKL